MNATTLGVEANDEDGNDRELHHAVGVHQREAAEQPGEKDRPDGVENEGPEEPTMNPVEMILPGLPISGSAGHQYRGADVRARSTPP